MLERVQVRLAITAGRDTRTVRGARHASSLHDSTRTPASRSSRPVRALRTPPLVAEIRLCNQIQQVAPPSYSTRSSPRRDALSDSGQLNLRPRAARRPAASEGQRCGWTWSLSARRSSGLGESEATTANTSRRSRERRRHGRQRHGASRRCGSRNRSRFSLSAQQQSPLHRNPKRGCPHTWLAQYSNVSTRRRISSAILAGLPPTSTTMACSSGSTASSVEIWESRSEAGM